MALARIDPRSGSGGLCAVLVDGVAAGAIGAQKIEAAASFRFNLLAAGAEAENENKKGILNAGAAFLGL